MKAILISAAIAVCGWTVPAMAQAGCGAPPATTIVASLPAHPFAAVASADGCSIFASLISPGRGGSGAVVLIRRDGDRLSAVRGVDLHGRPAMLALTRDEKLLIATEGSDVAFIDPLRLASGDGDALLGTIGDTGMNGVIGLALGTDERTLFASDERSASVTVIDLEKARANGFDSSAVLGRIGVGRAPVGLAVSADGRFLYSTSEIAPDAAGWPRICAHEGGGAADDHSEGALIVIDPVLARSDPAHATLARVPAGCNPVRVVLSPAGDRVYVSARGGNEILVFDAQKLLTDKDHARLANVPTGNSPVGLAIAADGARLISTNSNRFGADRGDPETLDVIDTQSLSVVGTIPVGAFPRELRLTRDGTLLVTNFQSNSLQLVPQDAWRK